LAEENGSPRELSQEIFDSDPALRPRGELRQLHAGRLWMMMKSRPILKNGGRLEKAAAMANHARR
jgi:hypothetical protein